MELQFSTTANKTHHKLIIFNVWLNRNIMRIEHNQLTPNRMWIGFST